MTRLLCCALLCSACACAGASAGPDASSPPDAAPAGPDAAAPGPDASAGPDAAMPPDAALQYDAGPSCARQSDCGDPVQSNIANVCFGAHCRTPGASDADGSPQTVQVVFNSTFDSTFSQPGNRPLTELNRLVLGSYVDGTPVTCADLEARTGSTQATRSRLDDDPLVNEAYRSLFVLDWTGTTQGNVVFAVPGVAPRGSGFVLLSEAWYGGRDGTAAQEPTGQRASVWCAEGVDLAAAPDGISLAVSFSP